MKIHKLFKKDFNDLIRLYKRIDCSHADKYVFPQYAYVSPKTYKQIENAIELTLKKTYKTFTKKEMKEYVDSTILNIGPCILTGLPDNVILVDTNSVQTMKDKLNDSL